MPQDPFAQYADKPATSDPFAQYTDHPTTPDDSSTLRNLGAAGLRLGTGIAAGKGGIPGALIAGAGEAGAEMLEGSTFHPQKADPESFLGKIQTSLEPGLEDSKGWAQVKGFLSGALSPAARIATAAGVGAVPVGKLMPEGSLLQRTVQGGLRSGALGTAGEAGREIASGEQLDPRRIGETGAISAVLGGLGGAVLGKRSPLTPEQEAERATAQTIRDEARAARIRKAQAPTGAVAKAAQKAADAAESEWYDVKDAGEKFHSQRQAQLRTQAAKDAAAQAKQDAKLAEQLGIQRTISEKGYIAKDPRIAEKASGELTMTTPYGPAGDEDEEAAVSLSKYLNEGLTPDQLTKIKENAVLAPSFAEKPAEEVGTQPEIINQARSQAASIGHPAEPITPEATAQGVAPLEGPSQPSSALARFFKSKVGAAGENYGAAKAAERSGEIGSADEAYNAFSREREALGQRTKPRTARVTPVEPTPASEATVAAGGSEAPDTSATVTPDWVKEQSDLADAASQSPDVLARLKKLAEQEKGAVALPGISPERARTLLGAGAGALIGGPIGSATAKDDDQFGALRGALIGAGVGAGAAGAAPGKKLQEIINFRNASLLASPTVIGKKFLGDTMGIGWEGLKQALPGPNQDLNYAKDLFGATPLAQPKVWGQRILQGLREDPNVAADLGTEFRAAANSPLGIVGRPLSAAGFATKKALEDVGTPPDVIGRITGLGNPETQWGQSLLNLQKFFPTRILRPFARTATHIAEGARNIPNPLTGKAFGGPAEDAARRGAVGALQMGVGAGSELYDESREAQGSPVSPAAKGLRMASMGLTGVVPYAVGKAVMGIISQAESADAAVDLINTIPGARAALPERYPNEPGNAYLSRIARTVLNSMGPSALAPPTANIR